MKSTYIRVYTVNFLFKNGTIFILNYWINLIQRKGQHLSPLKVVSLVFEYTIQLPRYLKVNLKEIHSTTGTCKLWNSINYYRLIKFLRCSGNSSQCEIGERCSNFSWDHNFHLRAYTLRRGMNPSLLLPAMGWIAGQIGFYSLGSTTSL